MAMGIRRGRCIGHHTSSGCMVTPGQRRRSQKIERWSRRPDQPAVHKFWSHSNDYLGLPSWLSTMYYVYLLRQPKVDRPVTPGIPVLAVRPISASKRNQDVQIYHMVFIPKQVP